MLAERELLLVLASRIAISYAYQITESDNFREAFSVEETLRAYTQRKLATKNAESAKSRQNSTYENVIDYTQV